MIHQATAVTLDELNRVFRKIQEGQSTSTTTTTAPANNRLQRTEFATEVVNITSTGTGVVGPKGDTGPAGPKGDTGAAGADGTFDTANVVMARAQEQELVFSSVGAPITDSLGYAITSANYKYSIVTDRQGNIIIGE